MYAYSYKVPAGPGRIAVWREVSTTKHQPSQARLSGCGAHSMFVCPATVSILHHDYQVIAPETPTTVKHGERIAIPVYDGVIAPSAEWKDRLQFIATVSVPSISCSYKFPSVDRAHSSHRLALFRVLDTAADGAQVLVELPSTGEKCYDCRLVHFMFSIK